MGMKLADALFQRWEGRLCGLGEKLPFRGFFKRALPFVKRVDWPAHVRASGQAIANKSLCDYESRF